MASSAVDICNEALALVGASPITALTQQTTEARLSNQLYAGTRDELLICHPWKFATKRITLVADPTPPAFDYGARFLLPPDCLRVYGTNQGEQVRWTEENGYLLVSQGANVGVKYISRAVTEAQFSINFCEAFVYKLAGKMALPLTQNASLASGLNQQMLVALKDAKSMNAQAAQGDQVRSDDWLWARY